AGLLPPPQAARMTVNNSDRKNGLAEVVIRNPVKENTIYAARCSERAQMHLRINLPSFKPEGEPPKSSLRSCSGNGY
ncbi:MAG: hypothetical protein ABIS30_06395, partial [Gallionella sp.]